MTAAVPEPMIDAMTAAGTVAEVQAQLRQAGEVFDHVVLYPPSFGLSEPRCAELAAALVDHLAPSVTVDA